MIHVAAEQLVAQFADRNPTLTGAYELALVEHVLVQLADFQLVCQTCWLRLPLEKRIFYVSTIDHQHNLHGDATRGVLQWLRANPPVWGPGARIVPRGDVP